MTYGCRGWGVAGAHAKQRRQTAPPVPALSCAVFDVDAEDGAPPRKLALNRGDNPYLVADRWLEEQGLPTSYK